MTDLQPNDDAPVAPRRPGFWNFNQVNPVRTLTFCAIGALAGLGIAGYGLFTANGTTTAIYPAEDAAIVNGVPVLMVDLVAQIRALYDLPFDQATRQQKTKALNDMIREELYVQRGVELGMPSDDIDVRTALVGAAEAQTASEAMTTVPTPTELIAFYNRHRDKYASEGLMTLADWIAPGGDLAAAKQLADRLRGGAPAASLGLTPSRLLDETEQFYFAARIHLGPILFDVAKSMTDGAVSQPVAWRDQIHIVAMRRNMPPVTAPYDKVKARVLADYMDGVKKTALAENTRFLLGRAQISVAPALR